MVFYCSSKRMRLLDRIKLCPSIRYALNDVNEVIELHPKRLTHVADERNFDHCFRSIRDGIPRAPVRI